MASPDRRERTSALEWRCSATEEEGFSSSRFRVDRILQQQWRGTNEASVVNREPGREKQH